MRSVLITGGCGFIGSHTCLELMERGYCIYVIDSFVNSSPKVIKRLENLFSKSHKTFKEQFHFIEGDIRNEKDIDNIFINSIKDNKKIDSVIHFAGLKSVRDSVLNPLSYWDININGTINLLNIMNKYKCKIIVFSSSASIYGLSSNSPIKENAIIKPNNPYGKTKATIESLLNDIYDSEPENWKIANLRYFNPIGAHPSGLIGESPIGIPNNLFPYITQVAAGIRDKLTIYGNDWPTLDGTGIRDYIHVMDLAEGHVLTLEYLFKNKHQLIDLNLGTGIGSSVLELVHTFEKANNIKIPIEFSGKRSGDSCQLIADNSLAYSYLAWSPKRSLERMCLDGWKWQSLNPEGYK